MLNELTVSDVLNMLRDLPEETSVFLEWEDNKNQPAISVEYTNYYCHKTGNLHGVVLKPY